MTGHAHEPLSHMHYARYTSQLCAWAIYINIFYESFHISYIYAMLLGKSALARKRMVSKDRDDNKIWPWA